MSPPTSGRGLPSGAKPFILLLLRPYFISAAQGAAHVVRLGASTEMEGVSGQYYEESRHLDPAPLARDETLARRLWDVSARLVGLDDAAAPS